MGDDMHTNVRTTLAAAAVALGIGVIVAAQAPAITRTVLNRADLAVAGQEAVTARADFPAGGATGRHTHPGDEVSYVVEGTLTLEVDGAAARTLKAGEAFHVPSGKVHNVTAQGGRAVVVANYLIKKGDTATVPAP
jgi:quercetin dioxygenase-like cupin family protein